MERLDDGRSLALCDPPDADVEFIRLPGRLPGRSSSPSRSPPGAPGADWDDVFLLFFLYPGRSSRPSSGFAVGPEVGMSSFPETTHMPFSFRTMPPSFAIFFSGMFRLGFFFFSCFFFFCCSFAAGSSPELRPPSFSGLSSGIPFSRPSSSRNLTQHSFCHLSIADLTTVSSLRSLRLTRLPVMGDVPHDEPATSPRSPPSATAVRRFVRTSHRSIASRSYV